jgi:amino acid transporter
VNLFPLCTPPPSLLFIYLFQAAVVLNCVIIAVLTTLPFGILVQSDVFIMCISYALMFFAFVRLRMRAPYTSRPFRLPAVRPAFTVLYVLVPLAIVVTQVVTAPWLVLAVGGGMVVGTGTLYLLVFVLYLRNSKRREYKELT